MASQVLRDSAEGRRVARYEMLQQKPLCISAGQEFGAARPSEAWRRRRAMVNQEML